jgi:pimeloyl-ACP methyl ester carboxylesterase
MRTAGARGTVGSVRAREPDRSGFVVRAGVRLYYEVAGTGPTVLLVAPWSITHSRCWKLQVPFLARHYRVVSYDARGNGRSDRPAGPSAYADTELLADALAVLDEVEADEVVGVGLSLGGRTLLQLAAEHPRRVRGAMFVAPSVVLEDKASRLDFDAVREEYHGWEKWNRHYWRRDLAGFAEHFFTEVFPEPHSTRQLEDSVAWTLQTSADRLVDSIDPGRPWLSAERTRELAARVTCPCLVVHGTEDRIVPVETGALLARLLGAPFETVVGGGHCVQARHPVWFNLRVRRFAEEAIARARA